MMKKIKPASMCSLKEIRLEKERLRYMLLRTELDFTKQLRQTRKLFTIPNLIKHSQEFITRYVRKAISNWFR